MEGAVGWISDSVIRHDHSSSRFIDLLDYVPYPSYKRSILNLTSSAIPPRRQKDGDIIELNVSRKDLKRQAR